MQTAQLFEQPVRKWEHEAACRGKDPSLFFGPNRFEPKRERLAREDAAKTICSSCAVTRECRQAALESGESFGVWGGLGEKERDAIDLTVSRAS